MFLVGRDEIIHRRAALRVCALHRKIKNIDKEHVKRFKFLCTFRGNLKLTQLYRLAQDTYFVRKVRNITS